MRFINKKRLGEFNKHTKHILTPYSRQIVETGLTDIASLSKAINGIIYQCVGDEDKYMKRDDETLSSFESDLKIIVNNYLSFPQWVKEFIRDQIIDGDRSDTNVVNTHLTKFIYRLVHSQDRDYFFKTKKGKKRE